MDTWTADKDRVFIVRKTADGQVISAEVMPEVIDLTVDKMWGPRIRHIRLEGWLTEDVRE